MKHEKKNTMKKSQYQTLKSRALEDGRIIITTELGTHYAETFDPTAARLILAAPDLLQCLQWALGQIEDDLDPDHQAAIAACHEAIRKAAGE